MSLFLSNRNFVGRLYHIKNGLSIIIFGVMILRRFPKWRFFWNYKNIVAGLKCWSSQYFVRSPVHNLQWITILKYSIPPVTISLPQWVKYRQFVEIYMHGCHLATDGIKIRLSKSKKPSRVHDLESWCVGYQKPHISVTKRIVVHSF